ncbi:MAG: helix-turn-helix transcriptional regulator [Bacteroidales bacterium]|nr:helix-turn-helix transcriptional regulator [Bacteroidales bacterium]
MIDRIQLILKSMNLSPSQFADEIQVQRSSISHILSGRNKPSLDLVSKILNKFPDISTDWLLFGQGQMIKKAVTETKPKNVETLEKLENMDKAGQQMAIPEFETRSKKDIHSDKSVQSFQRKNLANSIEKIVIFYSDKTFDEFYPQ